MQTTVSISVMPMPLTIVVSRKYRATLSQPKRGFVTAEIRNRTTTAVTAAAATQRHGCRAVTTVYSPLVLVVFERLMVPLIGRHPRRPGPR